MSDAQKEKAAQATKELATKPSSGIGPDVPSKPKTKVERAAKVGPNGEPETSDQKLRRLAAVRVPTAITRIRIVGNLAAYKPTEAQAMAMGTALRDAVQEAIDRLMRGGKRGQNQFELPT